MSDVKIIKLNNIYGRVVTEDLTILTGLHNRFAARVKNYFHMPMYKAGRWDGKIHFVEKSGKFYLGHFQKVFNYVNCPENKVEVDPAIQGEVISKEELVKEFTQATQERLNGDKIPYAHQIKGALKGLYWKRGILEHCTGSGKSLTIALVCNYLLWKKQTHKILILVPSINLIDQMHEDLIEYGIAEADIGKFYGYEKNIKPPIVVSTWQSLMNRPELPKLFTAILVDEGHGLQSTEIKGIALKAVNAEYRLGFTGTLPDDKCDQWLIEGVTGRVLDQVLAKDLIKLKIISDLMIHLIRLEYPQRIVDRLLQEDYQKEKEFAETEINRNKVMINIAKLHADQGQNVLILVKKIDHGHRLVDLLKEKGIDSMFIYGDTKPLDRQDVRKLLEANTGKIIVASVGVFAVGVSINKLHVVIFGAAGKSKIKTLQAVGRGLRLHASKTKLHLYDVTENFKYSILHLTDRKRYYKKNEFPLKEKLIEINV